MASISESSGTITFTCDTGNEAVARSTVTTTAPDDEASFSFKVTRRALILRIGTTAGGQELVADAVFAPGDHVVSITPSASTYYVEWRLTNVGTATLVDFQRVPAGVLELPTPWAADDVPSLRHTQSLNTMWFAGAGEEMQILERRGSSSWSLRPFLQYDGPFGPLNLSDATLTPAARTGTTTITASGPIFSSFDAGSLLRLTHPGQFETADLSSVDDVTAAVRISGIEDTRKFFVSITGTFTGTIVLEQSVGNEFTYSTYRTYTGATSVTIDDDLDNQLVYYRLRMTSSTDGTATASLTYGSGVSDGVARVVSVDADNEVTVDVIDAFASTSATTLWSRGVWSDRFGHPDAVTLYDGRLWAARGNQYWASVADDFSSFEIGTLADAALSRTFGGRMSTARWLLGGSRLYAGLSGFEAEIMSNAFEEVIKPENVRARNKTTRGSADASPVLVDDAAMFISRSRERLYRFGPQDSSEPTAMDLTRLNREIGGVGGFVELSWQLEPEPRIWGVRADGQVACMVYDMAEGVFAWFRLKHEGFIESVCVTPGTSEDDVHLIVRRTIDGQTKRYIEKLAPERWSDVEQAWRLHSALDYSGAATSTLTGLSHLEGEDVYVWGNGRQSGPLTVSSGSVEIDYDVTYAIIGLSYDGLYKSGRLNWGGDSGTALTQNKQMNSLGLVLRDTAGGNLEWGDGFFNESDEQSMSRLQDRQQTGLQYDAALQLYNEDIPSGEMIAATDPDTRLHLRMRGAGPVTVLGVVPAMKSNDGKG